MTFAPDQSVALGRTRAPGRSSTDLPGNHTLNVREHRPVDTEARDMLTEDFSDRTGPLVIPVTIGGIRGAIVARFIDFRPFHDCEVARE